MSWRYYNNIYRWFSNLWVITYDKSKINELHLYSVLFWWLLILLFLFFSYFSYFSSPTFIPVPRFLLSYFSFSSFTFFFLRFFWFFPYYLFISYFSNFSSPGLYFSNAFHPFPSSPFFPSFSPLFILVFRHLYDFLPLFITPFIRLPTFRSLRYVFNLIF